MKPKHILLRLLFIPLEIKKRILTHKNKYVMKTKTSIKINVITQSLALLCIILFTSCETEELDLQHNELESKNMTQVTSKMMASDMDVFEFDGTVYDISAAPDGSIMVGLNDGTSKSVQVIKNGKIQTMTNVNSPTDLQGVASIGSGNAFVTTGGTDLAQNGELYRVSNGAARMVADLAAFERNNDPDAFSGIQWKDQECEAIDGFSAGPQNNPYKVVAFSGNSALVADAAGNSVLSATTAGNIDWLAILTPPLDNNGNYMVRWNAGKDGEIPCYVQPVPTSVAVAPNGDTFIGELTGTLAEPDGVFPIGRSRVWKINSGANNVVLDERNPSPDYELLISGLTSVIDIEISPDGLLYVVELDESSWFSAFIPGVASGGTISAFDLDGNFVEVITSGLEFPSAITFDKKGNLWLLENNNTFAVTGKKPSVRMLDY